MKWVVRVWWIAPILVVVGLFGLRAMLHVDPIDQLKIVTGDPRVLDPPNSVVHAGSVMIARGGPVIFGYQTEKAAHITIAGRHLHGAGLVKERIILPAGPTDLRIAAPADSGLRLVWSPVGRRGEPEYMSASSLSPAAPDRATFDHPGTEPLDGLVALGILATLVATILGFARKRLAAVSRTTWLAMAAVLAVALAARLIDLGGFGQTWDEDVNWSAGRNYITNVVALDFSPRSWIWNYEHPPVMKLLDGIGAQFSDGFGPARALSALWVSLGCMLLVPIGTRLFRPRVGILAALIAALLPPLVAHGQIVGHESPTVLWWSLGILLALGVHDDLHPDEERAVRTIRTRLFWVGAVVGVAIASRFINGLLGPLVVAIAIIQAPARYRLQTILAGLTLAPLAAIIVFDGLWPRMWFHPLLSLSESLAKLDNVHAPEPFLGAITNTPGIHYFIVYLIATAPVAILAMVPAYLARAIADRKGFATIVVALWFVVPLIAALSPVKQDGVRYVMPCLTALAMIAAAGLDYLAQKLERVTQHAFAALATAIVAYLVVVLVQTHPYYLDYFGEQVGGAGNVEELGLFETAWWGEGVDRAVDYVNAHADPKDTVFRDCILPVHLAWFRDDLWTRMMRDPNKATWIIKYSTGACPVPKDARAVFSVTSDGAVLAVVYKRP